MKFHNNTDAMIHWFFCGLIGVVFVLAIVRIVWLAFQAWTMVYGD